MSKKVLIYASVHHKNTEKVVHYLGEHLSGGIETIDITKQSHPDISDAEWVLLASGIYKGQLHEALMKFMETTDFTGKKVIIIYTCGIHALDYIKKAVDLLNRHQADYRGSAYCLGFDTFGLLKLFGGVAKNHPNEADCRKILHAVESLTKESS